MLQIRPTPLCKKIKIYLISFIYRNMRVFIQMPRALLSCRFCRRQRRPQRRTEFAAFVIFFRTDSPFANGTAPHNSLKRLPRSSLWLQRCQTRHGSAIM